MIILTPAQTQFISQNIPGYDPETWVVSSAGAAGSDRRFLRIRKSGDAKASFVLVLWNSRDEDWLRFLTIEKDLRNITAFLPKIFASNELHGLILEEDLGNDTLKHYCIVNPDAIESAYCTVLDGLIAWQKMDITASTIIPQRSMDLEVFLWESEYFARHCVTEYFGGDSLLDSQWEKERTQIALAASMLPKVCIHRDFQSENILIFEGSVRFVDFQGARLGPAGYDLASLLFDPYIAELGGELTEKLFEYYHQNSPISMSLESFYICCLQRLMQALGAYCNLSIHKGKEQYRRYIPVAIDRCIAIAEKLPQYPRIRNILKNCHEIIQQKGSSNV